MTAPVPRAGLAPPPTPESLTTESVEHEQHVAPVPPAQGGWRASLLLGLWTWLGAMIAYGLVTFTAWVPFGTPPDMGKAYERWNQWDTVWYLIIAERGYEWDARSVAFFPLYPLLVRYVDVVLPRGAFEAALVVSAMCSYAALVMVHRLAVEFIGPRAARRAPFYLLAFPTGFFLLAAYNESLFIAASVGALYFMRRGQWWIAGALGAAASATRLVGILLVAAFAYEYLRQRDFSVRRIRLDALAIAIVPVGLGLYALYCARVFDDPLAFSHAQDHWFRTKYQAPWTTVRDVIAQIDANPPMLGGTAVRNMINLSTTILVLFVLLLSLDPVLGLGPQSAYLVIFSAGVVFVPVIRPNQADSPLTSLWRFALECVPVFLVLAKAGRSPTFDRLYLMPAIALQGVMIVAFLHSEFVA